jgi:ADP-heptose:LPS heptosyltransferase
VVFLAGIPRRIGPWSKLHSYLFYNLGMRQKRSQVKMHEAQYNLELLSLLKLGPVLHPGGTKAVLSPEDQSAARIWLKSQGWQASDSWVAVHPGMGGSALNWPERYYIELIEKLRNSGQHVLVTAGAAEEKLLQRVEQALKSTSLGLMRIVLFNAVDQSPRRLVRSIGFLGGLYQLMRLVVAPSTGPLHLAVGLGIPVVALYPPIRVQSPARWGPFSEKMEQIKVFVPEVQCPATFHCWGERCSFYPCMESLGVDPVLTQIQTLLKEEGLSHG